MRILHSGSHKEMSFELWTSQGAWFWGLIIPLSTRGIIGVALTEAEAIQEARAAIEELANSSYHRLGSDALGHACSAG